MADGPPAEGMVCYRPLLDSRGDIEVEEQGEERKVRTDWLTRKWISEEKKGDGLEKKDKYGWRTEAAWISWSDVLFVSFFLKKTGTSILLHASIFNENKHKLRGDFLCAYFIKNRHLYMLLFIFSLS